MKRIHRDRVMDGLYAELGSKDYDKRENALFQLALMLQRSNDAVDEYEAPDLYVDNLTREQLRVRLSLPAQRKAVDHLSIVIATRAESRATAFWALRSVAPEVGLAPALALTVATAGQLNNEAAFQVCLALGNWLGGEALDSERARQELNLHDPAPYLRTWSQADDARLANAAQTALETVQALLR